MDSLTQIVLGSAIGEATLGHKIGRKAALYGAALGTLPDLDVLWVKNAVDSFTEHRSFSHSIFVLILITPFLVYWLKRWHTKDLQGQTISTQWWFFAVYLCLVTHPLLDWFTTYGTQLLWPLSDYPFALSSVFIIDPMYTIPLLIGLLMTVWTRRRLALWVALGVSCSYLVWSLSAQQWQAKQFELALLEKGIKPTKVMTLPMPLSTLLWKNIALTEDGYWLSYRSIFDNDQPLVDVAATKPPMALFFASDKDLLQPVYNQAEVAKLRYFTKGFYTISQQQDQVVLSDLRMGGFGDFVFNFVVAEKQGAQIMVVNEATRFSQRPDSSGAKQALSAIWRRIWDQQVNLFQYFPNQSQGK